MISTPRPIALAAAVLSAVLLGGCAARGVQIAQLQNQPDRYDGKTVSVTGTVTSSYGIPLVPFQVYKIDDGTGEITVVSRGARAPSKGSRVQVSGKINELAVFGGQSIGLHIEESNRKIRG
jgi:DNA/RNA endonuclease YhcR with UshA esterase domain